MNYYQADSQAILLLVVFHNANFDVRNCPDTTVNCQSSMVALTDLPSLPVHLDHSNRLLHQADDLCLIQLSRPLETITSHQLRFVYLSNAIMLITECCQHCLFTWPELGSVGRTQSREYSLFDLGSSVLVSGLLHSQARIFVAQLHCFLRVNLYVYVHTVLFTTVSTSSFVQFSRWILLVLNPCRHFVPLADSLCSTYQGD